jgi:hypothetical protein
VFQRSETGSQISKNTRIDKLMMTRVQGIRHIALKKETTLRVSIVV